MNQSSTPRLGNLLRAEWRMKCRQVLADHLESSLGISVLPSDVRLIPNDGDAYNWIRHPERDHLFSKQLSKHSVGAYTELCREVGKSFKAVHKVCASREVGVDALQRPCAPPSMLALQTKLDELQSENSRLVREIAEMADKLHVEHIAVQNVEAQQKELQQHLATARLQKDLLTHENGRLAMEVRLLTKKVAHSQKGVTEAMSTLSRLEPRQSMIRDNVASHRQEQASDCI